MFQLATVACLILSLCEYGVCEQVYIIPSPDSPCAAQWLPCYTLTQYINCTTCQSSNVALIFMPGNHTLGTEFSITNKSCLSMSAYYYYRNTSSYTVTCTSSSWMNLSMVGNVMISGLSFINCGGNTARYVDNFILKNSSFTMDPQRHSGYMYSGRAWSVIGSETLSIDSCAFVNNAAGFRGGALYISTVTNAIITVCTFNNNTAAGGRGQGGVVYINNAMNTIINGSTFFNNTMRGGLAQGGALYIDAMYSVINGTMFINNTVRGGLAKGGALYLDAVYSIINGTMFLNNTARGGLAAGGALYVNVMNSVINGTTFEHNMAQGGGAEGGALYIRARNSIIAMSTFINNRATHGVPQYIVASTSVISNDATYEGMQLYDLSSNMTLNEGICDNVPANCHPPQPPVNGNVKYTTTLEGSQAVYQCDNGFIPYGEFRTTCCEAGEWLPDPRELTCNEEPFNCTSLPSIPVNGVLLNLTSTSAIFGCAPDETLNTVTITCVNQDVWGDPDPTDLITCSNISSSDEKHKRGMLILAILTTAAVMIFLISSFVIIMVLWAIKLGKKKRKGNDSVDASTPPIYEEIPSSYSKTPNDNKCNLELQENAAYQITRDFKFHENAAYCIVTTRNV